MATPANRRKVWIVALGASLLVLFVALATLNAFNTQLPASRHHPADRHLHRPVDRGVSALRRRAGPAGPQCAEALRRPAQPRDGHTSSHPHALGRGAGQSDSHRLDVRLQLPAAQPRRRPLVLAAGDRDARRQQQHGARAGEIHHRKRPRRSRLDRRRTAGIAAACSSSSGIAQPASLGFRSAASPRKSRPSTRDRRSRRRPRPLASIARRSIRFCASMRSPCRMALPSSIARAASSHRSRCRNVPEPPRRSKAGCPSQVTDDSDESANQAPTDPTDAAILAAAQRNDQPVFSLGTTDYALGATARQTGQHRRRRPADALRHGHHHDQSAQNGPTPTRFSTANAVRSGISTCFCC